MSLWSPLEAVPDARESTPSIGHMGKSGVTLDYARHDLAIFSGRAGSGKKFSRSGANTM